MGIGQGRGGVSGDRGVFSGLPAAPGASTSTRKPSTSSVSGSTSARERFHPVITDLSRTTQWFVRHRLNDVLILDPTPCPCGRRTTTLRAIEGRAEEVLWLPGRMERSPRFFPDLVRQAIYSLDRPPDRYRIEQHGMRWEVRMQGGHEEEVAAALLAIAARNELGAPGIVFLPWIDQPSAEKQKRIRCLAQPE